MKAAAAIVLILAAQSTAGNGGNAAPADSRQAGLFDVALYDIALIRPDGTPWDPDGGAPDPVLVVESYASLEDYSSADTVRTAPVADVTGAATWDALEPVDMHDEGALVIRVLDSDGGSAELMDVFTVETADLEDGMNSFEAEGGTRIAFRLRRIDD